MLHLLPRLIYLTIPTSCSIDTRTPNTAPAPPSALGGQGEVGTWMGDGLIYPSLTSVAHARRSVSSGKVSLRSWMSRHWNYHVIWTS